jgi:serine/threonine protein kinase
MHINRKQPISIQPDPLYLSWLEEKPQTIFVADTNADWYIAKNIFNGLYYLFKQKVVHFDIKMENIFVCNVNNYDIVKIGDFGFAKHIKQIEEPDIQRGTRKFIPKNNNCYHTHFFRDLYAFMGVVFTLAELTTFNKDQDGEPLEVLFLNEDYLKLNNEFYIILNILVMFEKEITDAKLGDYLKTTVDILNIYEAVYNEINAFFDKPKLTDGLKFETKQAKNKLLIPPKLPLVIPTLNTSKKTKGAYNNKFPSGYDAYGA